MKAARRQHTCTVYLTGEVDIDSNSNGKDAILNLRAVQVRHNKNLYLHLNSGWS